MLQTFYTETKSIKQELEMLHTTIYEQEIRFREYEVQLKEKQESLEFLVKQVNNLPRFYPAHSYDLETIPLGLPAWSRVAAKMIWDQFDGDHDGKLTGEELRQLKDQMRANHENVDDIFPDYPNEPLTAADVLKLYESRDGGKLSDDLRSLGILCGLSETIALSLSVCDDTLHRIAAESRRAKTRLREVFAASKQSLEDQARDIHKLQEKEAENELQLRLSDEKVAASATSLSKAKRELSSAKHALLNLRALVDE
ncbi:Plasma membrane protein [Phytophthora megakarya]|uniref:Plasma membrane protein n=1 Tax=Phytophthora megakarya TaxID=4795 RepID=A0A225WY51_9STRA|nr:Plasma membrane protein [Phytophthora megakarya]